MCVLFTSDFHLTTNTRDAYRLDWFKRLPILARKLNATTAVLGGDFTEFKDQHGAWLVNFIASCVHDLSRVCPVITYKGNHDYLGEDDPFFQFLGLMRNVAWYNSPMAVTIDAIGECMILPHTRRYRQVWKKDMPIAGFQYVFAHNTFKGSISESGKVLDGIPLDVFGRDQRVVSGDVHKPQTLGCVRYVGAPYTVDFGDDYRPRVFAITRDKVTSVWQDGPQKILVDVTMTDKLTLLKKTNTVEGDVVKIRVHVTNFDQEAWTQVVEICKAWADNRGVVLHSVQPIMASRAPNARVMRRQSLRRDDATVLEDFGKARRIDDRVMQTGRRIVEASNG